MSHQIRLELNGQSLLTLADILPAHGPMAMLMVAKTPAPVSVEAGHYFQGQHGTMLWNKLQRTGLLKVPPGMQPDDVLLQHGYGITDLVKEPHPYRVEPSATEYQAGMERLLTTIERLAPRVLFFVYKGVLDQILKLHFNRPQKARYGFNPEFDAYFKSRVFVFPMPGTRCTKAVAEDAMNDLVACLKSL